MPSYFDLLIQCLRQSVPNNRRCCFLQALVCFMLFARSDGILTQLRTTWFTQSDVDIFVGAKLNTVRIPVRFSIAC
jgi:hypothetical protein